jgi:peptide chain release factor 1
MNPSIRFKLEQLAERHATVQRLLADPEVTSKIDDYVRLSRENTELAPVVDLFARFRQVESDKVTAEAMLADPEMREMALEELANGKQLIAESEVELQKLLLPKDPNDEKNVIVEIRAGTGGDESALFAGDLIRMYTRYAERQRWQVEIISESLGEVGGFKEVIARIVGHGAYSRLKFESGGHRVQRVPETETQGRIHTSAATVAIMAEVDEMGAVDINPADVRVDTFRASGAGGQHINKTDSAVRLTHLPTGIVVECQDGRSQHKNKEQAWRVLASRIRDKQTREAQAKQASERRSLIGTGDRSDRIRTYNFPQGRVTDHRINLTLYKIGAVMDGDMDDIIGALSAEHQADQLALLAEEVK